MDKKENSSENKKMFKVLLCQYETIKQPFEISQNDPIFKLLSNFSEIELLIVDKKKLNLNLMKFFYFKKRKYIKFYLKKNK